MLLQSGPGLLLPPVGRGGQGVADQEPAPLGFELLAMMHQLLALPGEVARLFFLLARDPDHGQLAGVALQVTREPLAEGGGIARIGLYPGAPLVQLARRNHLAMRSRGNELPVEREPKPARFVNHMHLVTRPQQSFHPGHELARREAPRRLGQQLIVLRHRHVEPGMDIQSDLDHRRGKLYLLSGPLE